jgi:hydrogenase/urease accessory protein HupE
VKKSALLLAAFLAVGAVGAVQAHEVRPGYLELRQSGAETFDVIWKVPAKGELRLGIEAELPDDCNSSVPPARYSTRDAFIDRWSVVCPSGLGGGTIGVEGLSATLTDVLVRIEWLNGTTQVELLTPSQPSFTVEETPGRADVAISYLRLGIKHILLGIDHLLFVLALMILVAGRRRLVGTITAFTAAHSLTLAAAALGIVRVPQKPVEAVIALSIVFVASEIIRGREGKPGLTAKSPWIVAFIFGLLHGFGFAGALAEVGLPPQAIPLALLFFNVGVELGQLLFIGAVGVVVVAMRRLAVPSPTWVWRIPAYGIGAVAAMWTLERVAGFWG